MNPTDPPAWLAWLELGGYGRYVWGAYGATLLALLADAWSARRAERSALEDDA